MAKVELGESPAILDWVSQQLNVVIEKNREGTKYAKKQEKQTKCRKKVCKHMELSTLQA